jgi:hypothetical protein
MANNTALFGDGGALLGSGVRNLTVSASSISQNGAWLNGGAVATSNSSVVISRTALDGNVAGIFTDWIADPVQRSKLCAPAWLRPSAHNISLT